MKRENAPRLFISILFLSIVFLSLHRYTHPIVGYLLHERQCHFKLLQCVLNKSNWKTSQKKGLREVHHYGRCSWNCGAFEFGTASKSSHFRLYSVALKSSSNTLGEYGKQTSFNSSSSTSSERVFPHSNILNRSSLARSPQIGNFVDKNANVQKNIFAPTEEKAQSDLLNISFVPILKRNDPDWNFFDIIKLHVKAGYGGNGCASFRREKFVPFGGPDGGNGGDGGSVYFLCDASLNTLESLRYKRHCHAAQGGHGCGSVKKGVKGRDCVISVPLGTIIRTNEGLLLGELLKNGQTLQVAKGGRGGRGNRAFRSSIMKCPKICEDGEKTSEEWIQVELKIVADVGLVGVPNAGKSSLLAAVSEAHPKIANYSFSTTSPNLGVCSFPEVISRGGGRSIVISDIPGLICGAHKGVGLGLAFLRHIERCKILLHIIDGNSVDPLKDFQSIQKELSAYSPDLLQKPQILAVNKIDLPHVGAVFQNLKKNLQTAAQHTRIVPISALHNQGVEELMLRLQQFLLSKENQHDKANVAVLK